MFHFESYLAFFAIIGFNTEKMIPYERVGLATFFP